MARAGRALVSLNLLLMAIGCCMGLTLRGRLRTEGGSTAFRDSESRVDSIEEGVRPSFSWKLDAEGARNLVQAAYQIQIQDEDLFLWDSGMVQSSQSQHVQYSGPMPLAPHRYYKWSVRVWTNLNSQATFYGKFLVVSSSALSNATWIGSSVITMNELRKEFPLTSAIHSAIAYISGIGYYELYINGEAVDATRKLDPTWTLYEKRVMYVTYDVTSILRTGTNAIGVMLGNGWYSQDQWLGCQAEPNYGPPRMILALVIEVNTGETVTVYSDTTWVGRSGSITYDSLYHGEHVDGRLYRPGWVNPGFSDPSSLWLAAEAMDAPGGELTLMTVEPVRPEKTEISALSCTYKAANTYIYDFGQNLVGWVKYRVVGPAGSSISIKYTEIAEHPSSSDGIYTGMGYVDNLRSAVVTDQYILYGNKSGEIYEPRFTVHGFRYVEVRHSWSTPTLDSIKAVVVHTDVNEVGFFETSDDVLNAIHSNVFWGQKGNLMGIPSDCPQRDERKGWLGDVALTVDEAMFNFDLQPFYAAFLQQIADSQASNGAIPDTVPFSIGKLPGDPNWGTAVTTVAFYLIDHYGDVATVSQYYDNIVAWVDYLVQRATENDPLGLAKMYYNYGDWSPPPPVTMTNQSLCSSFALLNDLQHLSTISSLLNHSDDSLYYADLYTYFSNEFHQVFYNKSLSGYADGKQTANVLALTANVVPSDLKTVVVQSLLNDIAAYDTHLTTGIIGTRFLFPLLSELGYHEVALQIVQQTTYPSYGYMAYNPFENATTLWEVWDAPFEGPRVDSRNHIMFGSIDSWFYRYLAGINPNGLEEIILSPPTLRHDQLQLVGASYESGKGLISLHWQWLSEDTYQVAVQVPHNSRAVLLLPDFAVLKLSERDTLIFDGFEVTSQNNLKLIGILDAVISHSPVGARITIGSGDYIFYATFDTNLSRAPQPTVTSDRNNVFTNYVARRSSDNIQLQQQIEQLTAQLEMLKENILP
ncbi:rhamnosidase B [Pelomyxa schiedti]|nr:rhamnosidase B [Pelomyxa schiedti]